MKVTPSMIGVRCICFLAVVTLPLPYATLMRLSGYAISRPTPFQPYPLFDAISIVENSNNYSK